MILTVATRSRTELIDITAAVREAVAASGVKEGLCLVAAPHRKPTTATGRATPPPM